MALAAGRKHSPLCRSFSGQNLRPPDDSFFTSRYQAAEYALITLSVLAGIGALIYFNYFRRPKKSETHSEKEHLTR